MIKVMLKVTDDGTIQAINIDAEETLIRAVSQNHCILELKKNKKVVSHFNFENIIGYVETE